MLFERDSSNRNSKLSSLILLDEDCSSLSYQNRFGREMRIRWHFARINSSALGKFIHSSIGRCLSRCLSFLIVGIDRMARRLEELDQFYVRTKSPLFLPPFPPTLFLGLSVKNNKQQHMMDPSPLLTTLWDN